ncbi:MAG TPA: polysaccharide pyruvyl transferase family protein, partial [Thermoanaerobaculia bacterium]|nr:polysaccharide pyruvyl transferase family protein [Thermoanaerobaculia bacterium]
MEVRVAVIGAAFSANKGSASMLQAVLDNLPAVLGPCRFEVLTTYPGADARERPSPEVGVVSYRPRELVFPLLPLAVAAALLRAVGLRARALRRLHPALRALSEADVVVDVAGISFVDGRPFPLLVYNVLMTGVPLLLGARVVKCSQALGPFRRPLNRAGARLVLPRLAAVVARGDSTWTNLRELGLGNARRAADLAFTMALPEAAREEAARLLAEHGVDGPFVAVVPSAVVEGYCRPRGIDYPGWLGALIDRIAEGGADVVLVPHAARPGRPGSRMNDLPLVRELHGRVASERCRLIDRSLPPDVLRAVIERAGQLVTSRFHAMISALSVGTPVLVVGWSHKYEEVLRDFGLA